MPIYTKFGDKGTTSFTEGSSIPKDHLRVEAYGAVDELNSIIGVAIAFTEIKEIISSLEKIQKDLFLIGAELASKTPKKTIPLNRITELEHEIDSLERAMPPLKHFILPGGCKTAALIQHARTVCRRAERRVVSLTKEERINPAIITYLNRVGDLLFMLARFVNYKRKVEEIVWKGR